MLMKLAVLMICKLTQIQIVSSFTNFNPYKSKKTENFTKIETILNMQKTGVTYFCRFCDQIPQKDLRSIKKKSISNYFSPTKNLELKKVKNHWCRVRK